jgi:hypothetical protein
VVDNVGVRCRVVPLAGAVVLVLASALVVLVAVLAGDVVLACGVVAGGAHVMLSGCIALHRL